LLLNINVANNILSISKIYFGNTWVERELKEFNNIYFIGLIDSRKLLSNYNYNNKLNYNQFNSIISDLKI
jgi:Ni,Fe-hydrogenase III component G